MEQQGNGQTPGMGIMGSSGQIPYSINPYQANHITGPSSPASTQSPQTAGLSASPAQMAQHQLAYQHIHQQQQQQLQQQLQHFWANQYEEIGQENKRRTLQKNDIAAAITRTDIFDFLVDIVPREDLKDEVLASMPRGALPVGARVKGFLIIICQLSRPHRLSPGMFVGKPVDPTLYGQQARPYMAQQMWPQQPPPPTDS
ncbi:hypothetical protein DH2020_048994 [Rehmannia glutinosa]|uniref:Uncharacterized protein n=1 Tax=Rehmannia glutinosa TaxID=99300 RepID=A0ABR0U4Z1_REHGL